MRADKKPVHFMTGDDPPTALNTVRRGATVVEAAVIWVVSRLAAALVAAEITILFIGIVFRYVLRAPIVWSDELASLLFLWLAMLGAVVAFQRGEHMCMNAVVDRLGPGPRLFFELLAKAAALVFLFLILPAAWDLTVEDQLMTTPALGVSYALRDAAMPTGMALMALLGVLELIRSRHPAKVAISIVVMTVLVLAVIQCTPLFATLGNYNLLIFFVGGITAAVVAGIPIAFAFGITTFAYAAVATQTPMLVVVGRINEGMSHSILLAVPLFVFLGLLIEMTGMARTMVQFLSNLLGHVRGGLAYVLVGAMYLVSGISGSKAADMAAVAPILFPEMKARGAKPGELVALLAATGAQTETVPPSLVLITIGSVTGVSIAALFTGGLLPSLVLGITLCVMVGIRNRKTHLPQLQRAGWRRVVQSLLVAIPGLALPIVIRISVTEGVATATEVSTIGIVYAMAVGLLIYREFKWSRLVPMLIETATLSGAILFIIGTATAMGWALTQSGFSQSLTVAMTHLPGGRFGFIAASIVAFMILGSALEGIPAVVLFGPLLFPIAQQLGVNEIYYAMVVILAMGLGQFAPPIGVGYYTACAIGRARPDEGMGPIWGYLGALFVGLMIVAAIPWLSTCLLSS